MSVKTLVGRTLTSIKIIVGARFHDAVAQDGFNQDAVTADLKARGVTPINEQGGNFAFHVLDPDGFPVQISGNNPA